MNGEEIKQWRAERKLSQSQLAALLPVSVKTLQNWEQGRDKAPDYLQRALSDVERALRGRSK